MGDKDKECDGGPAEPLDSDAPPATPQDEPEKVGYGSPPIAHQFKKGRSGNPYGRPPKQERAFSTRQNHADILKAGEFELEVPNNGKRERLSIFQLALRKLHLKAAHGDYRSMKLVLELRRQALAGNSASNKQLHDVLEGMERDAVRYGQYPPNHDIFKRLNYWRKRSRKL